VFGRVGMARCHTWGPSVEGGGEEAERGGREGDSWAVTQVSMRRVAVAVVTLVTNVGICEGVGWAHISWVFIIAQGSIESVEA